MENEDLMTDDELEDKFTSYESIHENDRIISHDISEIDLSKFKRTFNDMFIPKGYIIVSNIKNVPKVVYDIDNSILEKPIFFKNTEYLGQVTYYADPNDYYMLSKKHKKTLLRLSKSENLLDTKIDILSYENLSEPELNQFEDILLNIPIKKSGIKCTYNKIYITLSIIIIIIVVALVIYGIMRKKI